MSKPDGDFCFLNCLHSLRTKNKLELHKKVYDFCAVVLPSEDTKISDFNQRWKSD